MNLNRKKNIFVPGILTAFLAALSFSTPAHGQEIDCLTCHAELKTKKVVHTALEMGCAACHSGIDATDVPHKKTNKIVRGLSSDQPDLCYGCHGKTEFEKKNVHAAVSMGCTGCHNPHSSKNEKLLNVQVPDLCYGCHDEKAFTRKTVHAPVAGGLCLSCHSPHASDQISLLINKPVEVCLACHGDVAKKPHALAGFGTASGHPISPEKNTKARSKKTLGERKDPNRPDRPFYCASCHDPHSTNGPRLLRFNAKSGMELCSHCHKY